MNITPLQSQASLRCNEYSSCRYILIVPLKIYHFLCAVFLAIANSFLRKDKTDVIDKVAIRIATVPVIIKDPIMECIPVPLGFHFNSGLPPLPPSPITPISKIQTMLKEIDELIHPDIALIFQSLFRDLDVVKFWNYEQRDGSYRLQLTQSVKVFIPKERALLIFDKRIEGHIDKNKKTLYFKNGFKVQAKGVTATFTEMTYYNEIRVGLRAGIWPIYQTEYKSVKELIETWGNIENRR